MKRKKTESGPWWCNTHDPETAVERLHVGWMFGNEYELKTEHDYTESWRVLTGRFPELKTHPRLEWWQQGNETIIERKLKDGDE